MSDTEMQDSPESDETYGSDLHPINYSKCYVPGYDFIKEEANKALTCAFPQRAQSPFTAAHVLLLSWAEDDLGVIVEIQALSQVFQNRYKFETQIWQIPSKDPFQTLMGKIWSFERDHRSSSDLMIIYYGGHSHHDAPRGDSVWRCHREPDSPLLQWSIIQNFLQESEASVFFILDCCHAANAASSGRSGGTKELLAACSKESITTAVRNHSFTRVLIEALKDFAEDCGPITVSVIFHWLITTKGKLQYTPVYIPLNGRTGRPSIDVSPRPDPSTSGVSVANPLDITQRLRELQSRHPSMTATRTLVSVWTTKSPDAQFVEYLKGQAAPPEYILGMKLVRVESAFEGDSTLLIVSMPVFIWAVFRDHPAFSFLGFVRSPNLLRSKVPPGIRPVANDGEAQQDMKALSIGASKPRDDGSAPEAEMTVVSDDSSPEPEKTVMSDDEDIFSAIQAGDASRVTLKLEEGTKLDIRDIDGSTPLHAAAERGDDALVELLVRNGANPNARDAVGGTPILAATRYSHETIVRFLLEKGADIEAKTNDRETPLIRASRYGHKSVVDLLLEKGAYIEAECMLGRTPLIEASYGGHRPVASLLLERGARIEVKDMAGDTPLLQAAQGGHEAVVSLLLDKGATVEAKNDPKETPLHRAAQEGHEAVVSLLLNKGATVEAKNKYEETPLHRAAQGGHETVVSLLLDKGATVEAKDKHGEASLLQAAQGGREAVVSLLLDKGATVEAKNDRKETPLHRAAQGGHEAVVSLLLNKGANVEAKNKYEETPLHRAAQGGHEAVVSLLLDKGATVEAKDKHGEASLLQAAQGGHEAVVSLLIQKGAVLTVTNEDGDTPADLAAEYGYRDVLKLLEEHGTHTPYRGSRRGVSTSIVSTIDSGYKSLDYGSKEKLIPASTTGLDASNRKDKSWSKERASPIVGEGAFAEPDPLYDSKERGPRKAAVYETEESGQRRDTSGKPGKVSKEKRRGDFDHFL